jgi:phage tail protein X
MPAGPFSRYRDLSIVVVEHATRGETRSLPVRRTAAPPAPVARRHRVAGYDTIDILARRYFGREDLYWQLLDANAGRRPDSLIPGELIDVPTLDAATRVRRPG